MPATVQHVSETEVVLEVRVPLGRSMLDNEKAIQTALNEAGNLATDKALEAFDADGAPIEVGGVRRTSRGLFVGGHKLSRIDVLRRSPPNFVTARVRRPHRNAEGVAGA